MALDMTTPSAAAIATAEPETVPTATLKERPQKPDEDKYKVELAAAEKAHAQAQEKYNAVKAKMDLAKGPAKDSPQAQRQKELRAQLGEIRQKQGALKANKGNVQEKIKALDANLKSRINEQKNARAKVPFKSEQEVDDEIARLEKQVDSGKMKLVDEKKALTDISNLRKQRKVFAGFADGQKGIDDVKQQISDLKKGLTDPESKALSEQYDAITTELDSLKAESDKLYKDFSSIHDERNKLQTEQRKHWDALKALKDAYYSQKKTYSNYEHEQFIARKEKQRAERDAYERAKRKRVADQRLEEASAPAYVDEILTAEGLIRYFDPSALPSAKTAETSKFAAQPSRTVGEDGIKGTLVSKKQDDEEVYFAGTGGKKGKKSGKRGGVSGTATPDSKYNLSIGVLEQLAKVGVEPPMSQTDVPNVVEKLKGKVQQWKADQDRKTKENIEKAQKDVERLEQEALNPPEPSSSPAPGRRERGDRGDRGDRRRGDGKKPNGDSKKDTAGGGDDSGVVTDLTQNMDHASLVSKEQVKGGRNVRLPPS